MKKILFALCFVLLSASMVFSAQGAPEKGPRDHMHEMGPIHMLEKLNLTPDQKHSIAAIFKSNREEGRSLMEATKTARHNLHDVMDKDPGNEAAIRDAFKAVSAAEENMVVNHAKVKAQIDAVLTPEQRAKMQQMKAEHKERREMHKDRMEEHRAAMDKWIDQNSK